MKIVPAEVMSNTLKSVKVCLSQLKDSPISARSIVSRQIGYVEGLLVGTENLNDESQAVKFLEFQREMELALQENLK